ncbi:MULTISPECIES: ParB/RepB/Spo0J family partition protein [Rhodanobacter]|uniref:ParB/RepB/Spo0J family partition protein n=1 Tax=Rhodanobacter TaxID=75309 RepID=UPI000260CC85|nr:MULTISPECIES: ParB/RepB/Spo0J family partition protein [Rhodanobacter]EIM00968.1 chromosome partitioning protein [Rhodanobacter denitrificans]KZC21267.1 chromosome partitioning protein ParB [Rhodanobacter denitrificans]UJJ51071.1 ParB/RepB/Spo0J family partition protein [Rhodanobacter denitrificans]UJJ60146.1 ParB/RepB/Spo0J family partition protein [Rhodanobacter denitrificans]UJM90284.1 ParB/RepB/Spo0J family partition protein [Rhodanobacter denitrificans]
MAAAKKRGLGRGLDALLGGDGDAAPSVLTQEGELRVLPIQQIQPGKYQPRRHWNDEALDELAASIKAQGLIQPVVVREIGKNSYELIAGERRWRAAQRAQLSELPALVKSVPEAAVPAMALIENIQRQDLTPLEEADALKRLIDDFELTHQQAADAVGRSRAAVSNMLRLTEMPEPIRRLLDDGKLEMGHARCLLTLDESIAVPLARQASTLGWSVRELEEAARRAQTAPKGKAKHAPARDPNIAALERELAERLATRVELAQGRGGRGKLVIHYHSNDELDGILGKIR